MNQTYNGYWVDIGDGVWQNMSNDSDTVNCEEVETERTKEYVEVFCRERDYHLRFYSGRATIKKKPGGDWEWVAKCHWDSTSRHVESKPRQTARDGAA
ncbi:MAG TPA: hypothetical protein VGX78_18400, partial [Pirellulales bacterium]|nr:hypothetical protein [Pirellulales bacterium]